MSENKLELIKRLDTFNSAIALISALYRQPEDQMKDFLLRKLFLNWSELEKEPLTEQLRVAANMAIDWATEAVKANNIDPNFLRNDQTEKRFII